MGETVLVTIPVSVEAARRLKEPGKREWVGRVVSEIVARSGEDPLDALLARIHARIQSGGLTEAEVDAELEAWRAERRP